MRPSQRARYAERIEQVVTFICAELEQDRAPGLTEMAAVAGLSEYHFHRVFRLMTGETVGEVVRRLRLARSLSGLEQEQTVAVAAGASAYSSQQAFSRAFRAQTGSTAVAVRTDGAELDRIASMLRAGHAGETPMRVDVVSIEPFRVFAVRNTGDYAELNQGFERVFGLVLEQFDEASVQGIYGVPHDDPRFVPASECRFDCALAVDVGGKAPAGLSEIDLGGGTWLRLEHRGDYDLIHERIDILYAAAVTEEESIRDRPLYIHYRDDPEVTPESELTSYAFLPLA